MTYKDVDVYDVRPNFGRIPHGQVDDFKYSAGKGFGIAIPWRQSTKVRRVATLPVWLKGLEEQAAFRQFVDGKGGRREPFWIPTYLNDFGLTEAVAAGVTTITVKGTSFATKWAVGLQFRFIALVNRDKLECYGVSGVSTSGGNTILTLSRGLDTALDHTTTTCCALLMARMVEDRVELRYTGDLATAALRTMECPAEYPPVSEFESAADYIHTGSHPIFLVRITDGATVYYFGEFGTDVEAQEETWQAASITFDATQSSYDMLGDELAIRVQTDDPDHPLLAYQDEKAMKNMTVELYVTDLNDLDTLNLNVPDHIGRIEDVDFSREGGMDIRVSSIFRVNEGKVPGIAFGRTCPLRTYQGNCHADEPTFTTAGTISAINEDPPWVEATAFGAKATAESDPNWFALGKVTVGTEKRVCTGQDGNRLYLNFPFLEAAVTDSISAAAGDDKRIDTCNDKFGRLVDNLSFYMPATGNPQLSALKTPVETGGKK